MLSMEAIPNFVKMIDSFDIFGLPLSPSMASKREFTPTDVMVQEDDVVH